MFLLPPVEGAQVQEAGLDSESRPRLPRWSPHKTQRALFALLQTSWGSLLSLCGSTIVRELELPALVPLAAFVAQ